MTLLSVETSPVINNARRLGIRERIERLQGVSWDCVMRDELADEACYVLHMAHHANGQSIGITPPLNMVFCHLFDKRSNVAGNLLEAGFRMVDLTELDNYKATGIINTTRRAYFQLTNLCEMQPDVWGFNGRTPNNLTGAVSCLSS